MTEKIDIDEDEDIIQVMSRRRNQMIQEEDLIREIIKSDMILETERNLTQENERDQTQEIESDLIQEILENDLQLQKERSLSLETEEESLPLETLKWILPRTTESIPQKFTTKSEKEEDLPQEINMMRLKIKDLRLIRFSLSCDLSTSRR